MRLFFRALALTCFVVQPACYSGLSSAGSTPVLTINEPSLERLDTLAIGLAIGYLSSAPRYEPAFEVLAEDGFSYVRAIDPFTRADTATNDRMIRNLQVIVDHGLTPFLALSNFPYGVSPPSPEGLSTVRYSKADRDRIFRYSNRYPPSDLTAYRTKLENLIYDLDVEFGREALRSWYFEIGNEPDAPRFFWGSADDFIDLFRVATEVLKSFDFGLRVGGAGFTSSLVAGLKHDDFLGVARMAAESDRSDFLSFHVYDRVFPNSSPSSSVIGSFGGPANVRVISEWNVDTRATPAVRAVLESDDFIRSLVGITRLCYQGGVDLLFVHKLMDDPRGGDAQLGIFDESGEPKQTYKYLKLWRDIVSSGYSVTDRENVTVLRGKDMLLVVARAQALRIDYSTYEVVEKSAAVDPGTQTLPAGEWVILRDNNQVTDSR